MTTVTASKPATAPAPSQPAKLLREGPMSLEVIDVVSNTRKKFDEPALKELAENIRSLGVISPITVRRSHGSTLRYELVAGERRLRAAKMAGLKEIPARVMDMTDLQALEYQAAENLHRKDLTPIEEAKAFKALLDARKFTVEQLAQLVDKSTPYVYRAVHLLELPKKAIEALEDGTITPAHGHQLLRVPAAEREKWAKSLLEDGYDGRVMTASELREEIENTLGADLGSAKFPKDKPFAGEIACTGCPNNSGNQGVLFDGAEKGQCTFRACFEKKDQAHFDGKVSRIKQAYPEAPVLSAKYCYYGTSVNGYQAVAEYTEAKAPALKEGALIICGREIWIAKKTPAAAADRASRTASEPSVERRTPKEAFIDRFTDAELFKSLVVSANSDYVAEVLLESALASCISQGWKDRLELLGVPTSNDGLNRAAARMKPAEKIQLAFKVIVARNCAYGPADRHAKDAGIDVKAFKKKTAPAAAKAWDNRKAKS